LPEGAVNIFFPLLTSLFISLFIYFSYDRKALSCRVKYGTK